MTDVYEAFFPDVQASPVTMTGDSLLWNSREDALQTVCQLWDYTLRAGWAFADALRAAVDQFGRGDAQKWAFLEDVASQTGVSVKTLQNTLSLTRSESAIHARNHGLTVSHGDALAGLDPDEAEALATTAAEQRWSVEQLRAAVREAKMGDDPYKPLPVKTVVIELDEGMLPDDMASLIVKFVKAHWGQEGLISLYSWVEDAVE